MHELAELWKGIEAIQFLRDGDSIQFTLRSCLLIMLDDIPAYGTLNSINVRGCHGCLDYIFKGFWRQSTSSHHCIYFGHPSYLKIENLHRQQKFCFNG